MSTSFPLLFPQTKNPSDQPTKNRKPGNGVVIRIQAPDQATKIR